MNEATRRDAWILVTGGSSGLGLECALRLARAGRAVVVASRDAHARERALRRIDDETRGA
ncbi:MAG: SDR family NAD(P)-dependent oxidoreductase, partial [Alphaproteobacteria bacterium]